MKEEVQVAIDLLDEWEFDYSLKNNGIHIIVTDYSYKKYDLYPTTGKWTSREDKHTGNGTQNLIRYMTKDIEKGMVGRLEMFLEKYKDKITSDMEVDIQEVIDYRMINKMIPRSI